MAKEIASHLGVRLGEIKIDRFPDHEIYVEILDDVRDKDIFILQPTALEPNDYLMELLIIVDALKRASARRITAMIPYFGYCRQDRQDKPNVPITAKLVADLLQKAGVTCVVSADLHAGQIQSFFDIPVDQLTLHVSVVRRDHEIEAKKFGGGDARCRQHQIRKGLCPSPKGRSCSD